MFTDVQFMTARNKELVLKNWETFLKHGLQKQHFTKRLYEHLHLHCGFIAHFNLQGFYCTYFEAGQDSERFFECFCSHLARTWGVNHDYDDINTAMHEVYTQYQDAISKKAEDDIAERLNLLEAGVKRSKTDKDFAKKFLSQVRI
jgi:hypothetical protein